MNIRIHENIHVEGQVWDTNLTILAIIILHLEARGLANNSDSCNFGQQKLYFRSLEKLVGEGLVGKAKTPAARKPHPKGLYVCSLIIR